MTTTELDTVKKMDPATQAVVMAVGVIVDRVQRLGEEDRKDLYELVRELPEAKTAEEIGALCDGMVEILDQRGARILAIPETDLTGRALKWAEYLGEKVRALRAKRDLTQQQLAELSGLPQSHISRIEKGRLSASAATVDRLAKALGVAANKLDPSR